MPDPASLDPGLKVMLEQLAALGGPLTSQMTPDEARAGYLLLRAADGDVEEVAGVEARDIAGVPCRVYRPMAVGGSALPVLAWFHGGGWVIGDLDTAEATVRRLANRSGCLVVSVDYRRAPEQPFPAAVDDCWAVTSELARAAGELGGNPAAVGVGGDSAGGNLAAVVALLARDEGVALRHQLLVYPVTDLTSESPSYVENGEGYLLTADTMRWFINHYAAPEQRADWRASPLLASDVAGVAPAHVITAGFDPLRDEGDAYAARLAAAGVPVVHDQIPAATHSFFALHAVTPLAAEAMDRAADVLRQNVGSSHQG